MDRGLPKNMGPSKYVHDVKHVLEDSMCLGHAFAGDAWIVSLTQFQPNEHEVSIGDEDVRMKMKMVTTVTMVTMMKKMVDGYVRMECVLGLNVYTGRAELQKTEEWW